MHFYLTVNSTDAFQPLSIVTRPPNDQNKKAGQARIRLLHLGFLNTTEGVKLMFY